MRAKDATTGKPVQGFCTEVSASVGSWIKCTEGTSTSITFTGLPTDQMLTVDTSQDLSRYPQRYYVESIAGVEPQMPREFTSVLEVGGVISTSVKRRSTGAPVERADVNIRPLFDTQLRHVQGAVVSDPAGAAISDPVPAGPYNLYSSAAGLGAQWVGTAGGSGQQRQAAVVTVAPGRTTSAPQVLFDEPGRLAGRVLRPNGSPYGKLLHLGTDVRPCYESPLPTGSGVGWKTREDGSYDYDLGPYEWSLSLNFGAGGTEFPTQWAGGAVNVADAQTVRVESGRTTTWSPRLVAGVEVKGAVTPAHRRGVVRLCDAETGELSGQGKVDRDDQYTLVVPAGHTYKAYAENNDDTHTPRSGWHDNAHTLATAKPLHIPAVPGPVTVNLRFPV
ncbi:hypothetical protein [Pilimelia anulata]|uniref:hypothetical protein n=1 Tax=Pilimelia anulata TaxID=53371 RepID=UPI001662D07D|nr:hypothetical protein [Pilimelia anulata]